MNWRNIITRAAWTSLQGALSAIPVAQIVTAITGGQISALQQLGLAALGGAVAALLSFLKTVATEQLALARGGASQ